VHWSTCRTSRRCSRKRAGCSAGWTIRLPDAQCGQSLRYRRIAPGWAMVEASPATTSSVGPKCGDYWRAPGYVGNRIGIARHAVVWAAQTVASRSRRRGSHASLLRGGLHLRARFVDSRIPSTRT
jgi:hypothetical protein